MLSRDQLLHIVEEWLCAWEEHDLDRVVALFDENGRFENWTGVGVAGRENIRKAWKGWFDNHGGFRFVGEEIFVDEESQEVVFRWRYEGPSFGKGGGGSFEKRRGVDLLRFDRGRIIEKSSYCKTVIEVDGRKVPLTPSKGSK